MKDETYTFIKSYLWFAIKVCNQKEDAEDVIQDVAIKILVRYEWFETLTKREKGAYIMRSIKNKNIDNKRKDKRQALDLKTRYSRDAALPVIELKEIMLKGRQHRFFEALYLFAYGFNFKAIAKYYNVSENTLAGRFRYARKFLKL